MVCCTGFRIITLGGYLGASGQEREPEINPRTVSGVFLCIAKYDVIKAETMLEETENNPSGTVVIGMKISKDNGEYMLFHPGVDSGRGAAHEERDERYASNGGYVVNTRGLRVVGLGIGWPKAWANQESIEVVNTFRYLARVCACCINITSSRALSVIEPVCIAMAQCAVACVASWSCPTPRGTHPVEVGRNVCSSCPPNTQSRPPNMSGTEAIA